MTNYDGTSSRSEVGPVGLPDMAAVDAALKQYVHISRTPEADTRARMTHVVEQRVDPAAGSTALQGVQEALNYRW